MNDDSDEEETQPQKITLPNNFVLQSKFNGKYLRYVNEDDAMHGFLKYTEDAATSPFAKFEVQNSKSKKGFVHIRCSYNNKYWVRWSSKSKYIVAAAKEIEEDDSKSTCTLFEPIYDYDRGVFRFRHVQLNLYLQLRYDYQKELKRFEGCLFAGSQDLESDYSDITKAVDWDTLFVLPKHIAFKANNGHFLQPYRSIRPAKMDGFGFGAAEVSPHTLLQFSASDIVDVVVANEIFTESDGHVRIKNVHLGKFWIHNPSWIHVEASESDSINDPNCLFWPVNLDNNRVALCNKATGLFCKRLTLDDKSNCLNAAVGTITEDAILEVHELPIARNIYNINLRIGDAKIYEETPMTVSKGELINGNSEPEKLKKKLIYEDYKASTWSSSFSTKFGRKVTIETEVPELISTEVEMSREFGTEYVWGETTETRTKMEVEHEVMVPPYTRVHVSVMATKASYKVPFSYTRRDVLPNGQILVQHFDDGVYKGTNCHNYKFAAKEEPL